MQQRDINRLQEKYLKEIVPALRERFGYKNNMAVPKITKVSVNTGFGRFKEDKMLIEELTKAIEAIVGQKLVVRKAKKSIAAFKVREGMAVGLSVTLRGRRMYEFLDKFISIVMPRTRDFRGIDTKVVDKQGNMTYGIKEHIVFPEITSELSKHIFGLEMCVTTTAKSKEEGLELLKLVGIPFKKD